MPWRMSPRRRLPRVVDVACLASSRQESEFSDLATVRIATAQGGRMVEPASEPLNVNHMHSARKLTSVLACATTCLNAIQESDRMTPDVVRTVHREQPLGAELIGVTVVQLPAPRHSRLSRLIEMDAIRVEASAI